MARSRRVVLFVLVPLALLLSLPLLAQTSPNEEAGFKMFGSYHGGDIDSVSLTNGKLQVHIPLVSYPQRGGKIHLEYYLLYSNPTYYETQTCNPQTHICTWYWHYTTQPGVLITNSLAYLFNASFIYDNNGHEIGTAETVYDPDGAGHAMGNTTNSISNPASRATDGSGFQYDPTSGAIIFSNGVRMRGSNTVAAEDPDGNQINYVNGGLGGVTDTLGRGIPSTTGTATSNFTGCTGTLPTASATLWSPPGPNGGSTTFKFCYVSVAISTHLGGSRPEVEINQNVTLLQSVVLPNGTAWTFQYDNSGYANLQQITRPTGGTHSYTLGNPSYVCLSNNKSAGFLTRTINDGTTSQTWQYQNGTVIDPAGNYAVHTISSVGFCSYYETKAQYYQGNPNSGGALLKTVQTDYTYVANPNMPPASATSVSVFPIHVTTTWPNGRVSRVETDYDASFTTVGVEANASISFGNPTAVRNYDYGSSTWGPLLRETFYHYEYAANGNYFTYNYVHLPNSVQTCSPLLTGETGNCGPGNSLKQRALSTYGYDEYGLVSSGISTQHDANPPAGLVRGNQTSVNRWLNTSGANLTDTRKYYDTGTVSSYTDPASDTTTYSYSSAYAGALVTRTTYPNTSSPNSVTHSTSATYDFNTSLVASSTDENSQTTSYAYIDPLWRITQIAQPTGGSVITFTYNDAPVSSTNNPSVERTEQISSTQNAITYQLYDGLGREIARSAANGQGTYDKTDTCYNSVGLVGFVSYPYQASTYNAAQVCSSSGDSYVYDGLKRTTSLTHSDSTVVTYTYTGAATEVSDEGNGTRSVQKISQVDGLGRLQSLCEVTSVTLQNGSNPSPSACGQDISGTGFLSSYQYDGLGNLTLVTQGGLNSRSFTYDSLSRLITATNPESGAICYGTWSSGQCVNGYDADGNLLTRTRPAPNQSSSSTYVTTSYTYDPLHRLRTRTYSDGTTPPVTLNYDETSTTQTLTNGRLSSEYTGSSTAMSSQSILGYDKLGRIIADVQCTPQNCGARSFTFSYAYDYLGDMTSSSNGNGINYTLTYDNTPRLTQVATSWLKSGSQTGGNLISSLQYNARGEPLSSSLYNGLNEGWSYDARGRLQSYAVGSVYNLSSITYSGNSSVTAAVDNVNGTWSTYQYDDFNHLTSSACTANCPGSQSSLAFSYSYDRYGNRWSQTATAGQGSWPQPQYSFDANNRITTSGFTYDAAGNIINDGIHGYTYDAENRIAKVDSGSTGAYSYDAEGRRVGKTSSAGAFEYLFDLGGRVMTELVAGTITTNRSEGYAGGRHLVTQNLGSTYFIHTDWLGTERARTS